MKKIYSALVALSFLLGFGATTALASAQTVGRTGTTTHDGGWNRNDNDRGGWNNNNGGNRGGNDNNRGSNGGWNNNGGNRNDNNHRDNDRRDNDRRDNDRGNYRNWHRNDWTGHGYRSTLLIGRAYNVGPNSFSLFSNGRTYLVYYVSGYNMWNNYYRTIMYSGVLPGDYVRANGFFVDGNVFYATDIRDISR